MPIWALRMIDLVQRKQTGLRSWCAAVLFAMPLPAYAVGICSQPAPEMAQICGVYNTHCAAFFADPDGFERADLLPLPQSAQGVFRSNVLRTDVLGYRKTAHDNVVVVYADAQPTCEMLITGMSYYEIATAYRAWRMAEGETFVATSDFEPVSTKDMPRAYAAVFLASRNDAGRVTEITLNWNLGETGLTRLSVSDQPEREHTRNLLAEGPSQ